MIPSLQYTSNTKTNHEDTKTPRPNTMNENISKNYVELQENICSTYLQLFNNKLGWFKEMNKNEENSIIDYTCIDRRNRKCHVELKQRLAKIDDYDTILLDATKLFMWTKIGTTGATNNEQRLYFNFMNDGVIIFDINNQSEFKFYPNKKIWNPALGKYEYRDKIGLPTKNAIIFKYNKDGTMTRVHNERYNKTYNKTQDT